MPDFHRGKLKPHSDKQRYIHRTELRQLFFPCFFFFSLFHPSFITSSPVRWLDNRNYKTLQTFFTKQKTFNNIISYKQKTVSISVRYLQFLNNKSGKDYFSSTLNPFLIRKIKGITTNTETIAAYRNILLDGTIVSTPNSFA